MATPRRVGHWLLALTYLLTTALVDGDHRHGPEPDERPRCERACQSPGAHISGHDSPDLSRGHKTCPACQFRTLQVLAPEPLAEPPAPLIDRLTRQLDSPLASPLSLSSTVRGPPTPA